MTASESTGMCCGRVAYDMLGSVADAEDVVRDTWLRWAAVDETRVGNPRAYLVRIATRQALDRLRQARTRRESYVVVDLRHSTQQARPPSGSGHDWVSSAVIVPNLLVTAAIRALATHQPTVAKVGRSTMDRIRHEDSVHPNPAPAIRLAATLLLGGSLHFLAPKFFDDIIPRRLPGKPRAYTYASGIVVLSIETGLSIARTRRVSATLAGVFFIAVMPAKVVLAVSWCRDDTKRLPAKIAGIVQLFWQIPLITEACGIRRNATS